MVGDDDGSDAVSNSLVSVVRVHDSFEYDWRLREGLDPREIAPVEMFAGSTATARSGSDPQVGEGQHRGPSTLALFAISRIRHWIVYSDTQRLTPSALRSLDQRFDRAAIIFDVQLEPDWFGSSVAYVFDTAVRYGARHHDRFRCCRAAYGSHFSVRMSQ
jgi:hypothetical protein